MEIKQIAIIGVGLLGGSLALAVKSKLPDVRIVGLDTDADRVKTVMDQGIIDEIGGSIEGTIAKSDVLILASPIASIRQHLKLLSRLKIDKELILFDIGSSKRGIIQDMESLPNNICAIGGHPMTGPMTSGYTEAHPNMFKEKVFVITPSKNSTAQGLLWLENFVELIGSRPVTVNADKHDDIMASISHLPSLISIPFLTMVDRKDDDLYWLLSAGGFKRISSQINDNPAMWKSILYDNRKSIASSLTDLNKEITNLVSRLESDDQKLIEDIFTTAQKAYLEGLE
ncbi:prephenate dehydrogenase [Roseivirga misakiensis]|uniref:Prephenate/arogenate dehydrogenase domain-containing protein n=1 Tax=Roseivirga misakiensis TaxID=1563681 RepID=A0A1E5T0M5_9BACT|nr:prephenate dehydrogenase [Roseivirga misakiensis]OEK04930.1 hypothetical protein BFP71_15960 [Roseivirga misakiensis]